MRSYLLPGFLQEVRVDLVEVDALFALNVNHGLMVNHVLIGPDVVVGTNNLNRLPWHLALGDNWLQFRPLGDRATF